MSIAPATGSTGLPVVNQATEPTWVRQGSSATQQDYATALAFERVLVEQLTKSLAATSGFGGEPSEEGETESGGSSELSSMLPQALSSGVMNAGGLGLAAQLTREIQGTQPSASHVGASGGTST
ncbi:MAG: hypothetical protein ACYDHN_01825 [Solirubrobacteraceae bacterium]